MRIGPAIDNCFLISQGSDYRQGVFVLLVLELTVALSTVKGVTLSEVCVRAAL